MSNDLEKSSTEVKCPKCDGVKISRANCDPPQMRHCEGCGYDWDQSEVVRQKLLGVVVGGVLPRGNPFVEGAAEATPEKFPNSITGEVPVQLDDGGAFVPDLEGEARRKNADELLVNAMRRLEEANARIERLVECVIVEKERGDDRNVEVGRYRLLLQRAVEVMRGDEFAEQKGIRELISECEEQMGPGFLEVQQTNYDTNIHPE